MIRKCIACEFRSDEPDVQDCPFCFKVLVASPLESFETTGADEPAEPPKAKPTGGPMWVGQSYPTWTPPRGPWEILSDNGLGWILLFVLVVGIGFAAQDWLVSGPAKSSGTSDASGRVRVGMHVSEALRQLAPARPVLPPDSTASGVIDHEADGRHLRVHYKSGHVTEIEEKKAETGGAAKLSITATD